MYNAPPPQPRSWITRFLLFLALMAILFILLLLGMLWLLADFRTDAMLVVAPARAFIMRSLL